MRKKYSFHRPLQGALILATSSVLWGGAALTSGATAQPDQQLVAQSTLIETNSAQSGILYLNSDHAYSYNLKVTNATRINNTYIPVGATVQGQYEPASGGLRYVANAVEINGNTYPLDAASEVIEDVKDPRDTSAGSVAEDAGIGAASGAVLGEVLGDEANIEEIVGGAAAGAAVGNVTADRVVVVEPNEPIILYSD